MLNFNQIKTAIPEFKATFTKLKQQSVIDKYHNIEKSLFSLFTSNSYLELTIITTEQCNFRCVYCYQDFQSVKLNEDRAYSVIRFIEKSVESGLRHLHISWFGGEPTLNVMPIHKIGNAIKKIQLNNNLVYTSNMSSNGYLLSKNRFNDLLNSGVNHFQISLDGWQEFHDQTRIRKNGQGSFYRIWKNLLCFRSFKKHFIINLRLHITQKNIDSIEVLVKNILKEFSKDHRFNVMLEEIKDLGGESSASQLVPDKKIKNRLTHIKTSLLPMKRPFKSAHNKICYAAIPRHLLIFPDGQLGKCTVMLKIQETL